MKHIAPHHGAAQPVVLALVVVWLIATVSGFALLVSYSQIPGEMQQPPTLSSLDLHWPSTDQHRLVMALHPRCSCSRASVNELQRILQNSSGRLAVQVLAYQPTDAEPEFCNTGLIEVASSLPNTSITTDVDGRIAKQLDLLTSGAVALYDQHGRPTFAGGITVARGHEGKSVGADSIISLVHNTSPVSTSTCVFGCPIHAADQAARIPD